MVYTDPIVTSDVDEFYPEDPIAVFEAESALQVGYEPIPQEPDFNQIDATFSSDDLDENDTTFSSGDLDENDTTFPSGDLDDDDATFPSGDLDENDVEHEEFVYYLNTRNHSSPDPEDDSRSKSFPPPIFSISNSTEEGTSSGREIDMNDEKVEEVKKIMFSINLDCSIYPDWVFDLPEEELKDYILRRFNLKREGNPLDRIPELVVD